MQTIKLKQKMSEYLPIDIVERVLLRLPIKPLKRSSLVCKEWNNLITSTKFISAHMDFTKSHPNSSHFLIEYRSLGLDNERNYVLYCDDEVGKFEEYGRFTIKKSTEPFSLVGCCNGLICLASVASVVLWNPVVRRALRLPKSNYFFGTCFFPTSSFVFDHIGNDYKVLRMHTNFGVPPVVDVFRLSTGLWEDISYKAPLFVISPFSHQVDLKGIAHWIGKYNSKWKIITCDVHEEVFDSIELPFDVVDNDKNHRAKYLFVFEESLFLMNCVVTRDAYEQPKFNFDAWRMGNYNVVESWSKVHTWVFDRSVTPLGFRKTGEMLWNTEGRVMSTNLVDASHNYLGSCESDICNFSCARFAESFILLDKSLSSLSSGADGQKLEIRPESPCF